MPPERCVWHRCKKALKGKQTRFCSLGCKNNFFVARRRRKLKEMAVAYLGGKCQECGYSKSLGALQFHHKSGKSFGIAHKGYTRSWKKVRAELKKCVLVCANCHAERHCND